MWNLYRRSWFPDDEPYWLWQSHDFPSSTTITLPIMLFSKNSQQLFDWLQCECEIRTGVHGPLKMNPTDFGNPITFPQAPPWGCQCCFLVKSLNNYLIDCSEILYRRSSSPGEEPYRLCQSHDFPSQPWGCKCCFLVTTIGWTGLGMDALTFLLAPSSGQIWIVSCTWLHH